MTEENIEQKFSLKEIDEKRNYFIEEINQNELISKKHKKVCRILSYTEHLLILASVVMQCVSSSAFTSLTDMPVTIASSAGTIKICAITARIKKYRSIIKEKKNKHDKMVLLARTILNTIEVLISKALINSNIKHDEFVSVNNVLKEYDETKEGRNKNYNDK